MHLIGLGHGYRCATATGSPRDRAGLGAVPDQHRIGRCGTLGFDGLSHLTLGFDGLSHLLFSSLSRPTSSLSRPTSSLSLSKGHIRGFDGLSQLLFSSLSLSKGLLPDANDRRTHFDHVALGD